jgi:hypothetical protein
MPGVQRQGEHAPAAHVFVSGPGHVTAAFPDGRCVGGEAAMVLSS